MAQNEWILGEPAATQSVYEWILGEPHVLIDNTEEGPEPSPIIYDYSVAIGGAA